MKEKKLDPAAEVTSLQVMNLSMRIVLMSGQFSTGNICAAKSGKGHLINLLPKLTSQPFCKMKSIFNLVPLVALV